MLLNILAYTISEDSYDRSAIIKVSRTHAYGKVEITWVLKKSTKLTTNLTEHEDNVKYINSQFLESSGKVVCEIGKFECNTKVRLVDDSVSRVNH